VIDLHMHPGTYEDMGPLGKAFLRRTLPSILPDSLKDQSLSLVAKLQLDPYGLFGIKTECDDALVERCGLFAVYAPESWGITSNAQILGWLEDPRHRRIDGSPLFFGLASIDMREWPEREEAALSDLRRTLQHPLIKGIKLAFIHNNTPLDDARFDGIYRTAATFKVPVYHHVGSSPLRKLDDFASEGEKRHYKSSYDPSYLERAIAAYPSAPFVLGHVGFDFNREGFDFTDEVYQLAARYPNVYLEISGFGTPFHDPRGEVMELVLRSVKEKGLIGRVLYGSDGPTVPGGTKAYVKATLEAMDRVGYTVEEATSVMSRTTRQLFRLD
jgi:predicted TIM-barrel fold metal-dependent hydrolase